MVSGILMIKNAQRFINDNGGGVIKSRDFTVSILIFTVFCSLTVFTDLFYKSSTFSIVKVFVILAYFIQFYVLDMTKRWLPFCFTASFIVAGCLFKLSVFNIQDSFYYLSVIKLISSVSSLYLDNPIASKLITYSMMLPVEVSTFVSFIYAVFTGVGVFFLFLLFRHIVITRCQKETFGLGDVYLITGLSVWLSVPAMFYILFFSAVFAGIVSSIKTLVSKSGQYEPFAPYLCGFSALYIMIPTFTKLIAIVGFL
jgi:general secretion pathway protein O